MNVINRSGYPVDLYDDEPMGSDNPLDTDKNDILRDFITGIVDGNDELYDTLWHGMLRLEEHEVRDCIDNNWTVEDILLILW